MNAIRPTSPRPFRSAFEAWMWCAGILESRRLGASVAFGANGRICDADDVVRCMVRAYDAGRLTKRHATVLRKYGFAGTAPLYARQDQRADFQIWQEALKRLEPELRSRRIVG